MERVKINENDLKYCADRLNESPEKLELYLAQMRDFLKGKEELRAKTDDYNLIRFLRAAKYDIEKAKKKISCYYKFRNECDAWFKDRNPNLNDISALLEIGLFLPVLQRDSKGRCIIIVRSVKHDPKVHSIDSVFKVGFMVLDLLFDKFEDTSVYGVKVIFDLDGVCLGHAQQLSISIIKRAVHSWQECYPVRVKSLDWVNTPTYINVVLNIFRSFMNQKLKKRVYVHGKDTSKLYERFERGILPEEYGGEGGKLDALIAFWRDAVMNNKDWYSTS
ncbi:retinol-binding protein pinta-like [Cimex lectularius]|uniref:CRAL-TRIO domain-containing protein n=1 Tax=Cimex lectularius TaxID=79782 RepID=A0A8I6RZP0_CIMLE|nr:retinol-binding protein pinta-like [Cimex lectularius]